MNPLRSRLLLNLILLLGVLALLALVLWPSSPQPPTTPVTLLSLDSEAITHLRITHPERTEVELERLANGQWQLRRPIDIAANSFRVEALLRVTQLQSLGQFAVSGQALEDYGLATPLVSLELNHGQYRLDFGGHTALDHRRYVRLGHTIHILSDTLFYHLIGDAHGFIAHQLLPEQARIRALHLPGLSLSRESGAWQVEPPEALPSADRIQEILDAWRHPGVIQVRAYQGGMGTPLRVELEDGETLHWLWLTEGEEAALARPELGIQYQLSASSARALLGKAPEPPSEP